MLERNLLKAGEYVELVPSGIPVTLKYKPTGNLENVLLGICTDGEYSQLESCQLLYSELMKKSKVPMHLNTNNGSLFVEGVIYTGKDTKSIGSLPECIVDELLYDIQNEVTGFNFFAGNVVSMSIQFTGAAQVRSWLQYQGYNILPGLLVPLNEIEEKIKSILKVTAFSYEEICGAFTFEKQGCSYKSFNYTQNKIKHIEVYLDASGCVRCKLEFENKDVNDFIYLSYYDVLKNNLYETDYVRINSENKVVLQKLKSSDEINYGKYDYTCPFCGKKYLIDDEFSKCPDKHCLSRMYLDIEHFAERLNLPAISYEEYLNYIDTGVISKFSEILDADIYKSLIISTSLYDILDAIIPVSEVRNRDDIWKFCSACNNSWESINYYLNNPNCVFTDLKFISNDLVHWMYDSENVKAVQEIIQYSNIVIDNNIKKFEGSPIFRGKKIFITGEFVHGSYAEIESILRSYSAEISDAIDADCGILGDKQINIDGSKVNLLKNRNKPIFTETAFFEMYDIDADLNI